MTGKRIKNYMSNLWALQTEESANTIYDNSINVCDPVSFPAPIYGDTPLRRTLTEFHEIFGHRHPDDIIKLSKQLPGMIITDKTWNGLKKHVLLIHIVYWVRIRDESMLHNGLCKDPIWLINPCSQNSFEEFMADSISATIRKWYFIISLIIFHGQM